MLVYKYIDTIFVGSCVFHMFVNTGSAEISSSK